LRGHDPRLCAVDGRDPPEVSQYDAHPGDYGFYDPENHTLNFGSSELEHDDPREAVNTLAHEDRHAYQDWVLDHPKAHHDAAEVDAWRDNSDNYIRPELDYEGYRNQPLERDVWAYGDRVAGRLYEENE